MLVWRFGVRCKKDLSQRRREACNALNCMLDPSTLDLLRGLDRMTCCLAVQGSSRP